MSVVERAIQLRVRKEAGDWVMDMSMFCGRVSLSFCDGRAHVTGGGAFGLHIISILDVVSHVPLCMEMLHWAMRHVMSSAVHFCRKL